MKKIFFLGCIFLTVTTCLANTNINAGASSQAKSPPVFAHDAAVVVVWSTAQIPVLVGGFYSDIQAVVKNTGSQTLLNLPVTLKVEGIINFTDIRTIPHLPADSSYIVGFASFIINQIGINHAVISLPDDDDTTNNSAYFMVENTAGLYSLADTSAIAGNFGLGTAAGYIFAYYPFSPCCSFHRVTAVRVHISDDPANIGQTVSAAIFYQSALPLSQSATVTLTAADLNKWMVFPVPPTPFLMAGIDIKAGFYQSASSTPYYPVSYQRERPVRPGFYYYGSAPGVPGQMRDTSTGRYMIQVILDDAVLPITWQSFTAKQNGPVNELAWSTAQEINLKQFVIERSGDASAFTPIGYTAAAGNSNTLSQYYFEDTRPIKGINYYRLRAVDIDGQFKLSEIRSLQNDGANELAVYPNPVMQTMNVAVNSGNAEQGILGITDIEGREIFSRAVSLTRGNNVIAVDAANIPAGLYIIKLKLSDQVLMQRVSKM